MINLLFDNITTIKRLIFYPQQFFREAGKESEFEVLKENILKIISVLILLFLFVHSIGDLINAQIDRKIRVNLTEEAKNAIASTFSEPAKGTLVTLIFFARMSYLIFWSIFFGFFVASRTWIFKMLDQENQFPSKTISYFTLLGFIPLFLISGIVTFINQIFPMSPYLISNFSIYLRIVLVLVASLLALYFEKRILNESLMSNKKLTKGATSIIWFSPYVILYFIFSLAILLIRLF